MLHGERDRVDDGHVAAGLEQRLAHAAGAAEEAGAAEHDGVGAVLLDRRDGLPRQRGLSVRAKSSLMLSTGMSTARNDA